MRLRLIYYLVKNLIRNSIIRKPPEKIKEVQLSKLRKLIKFVYKKNLYYRELFDKAGITPDSIQSLDDIRKIPVSTRQNLVQAFPHKILSKGFKPGKNCFLVSTSGSTGVPIKIYKSYDTIFSTISMGSKKFMGKIFNVDKISIMSILVYAPETIEQILTDFVMKSKHLPFRKVNALDDVNVYIENLNEFKPQILFTYPSVLKDIKMMVDSKGLNVHSPRLIFTSAEIFEKEFRKEMKKIFPESQIIDTYFSTEAGLIASNCKEGDKMHILNDRVILEIIDNDGNPVKAGETGNVVITDLNNFASPVIRYDGLNDLAKFSETPCSCGHPGTFLEMVAGRKVDSIVTKSGRIINPFRVTEILSVIKGIAKYQVIQKALDVLDIFIVPELDREQERIGRKVYSDLKELFGDEMMYEIIFVNKIERSSSSGMFQLVKSEVSTQ